MKLLREILQTVEQDFDGELRIPEFGCRDFKATRGDAQPWKKTLLFVERRPENRNGFCTIFIIPFDIAIASISKDNDEFPKPHLLLAAMEMHKNFQSLFSSCIQPFCVGFDPEILRNSGAAHVGKLEGQGIKTLMIQFLQSKLDNWSNAINSIKFGVSFLLGLQKRGAEDGARASRKP